MESNLGGVTAHHVLALDAEVAHEQGGEDGASTCIEKGEISQFRREREGRKKPTHRQRHR